MKKFLAIQLDGLSYRKLEEASHKGFCPNMTNLMNNGYKAHKYNCGLPSNTPFAQAGIMYGKNDHIPGFTFVDKKIKKEFKVRNPLNTTLMEHLYLNGPKGILENGRSYVNLFSGGAEYSRLTTSKLMDKKWMFKQFDILLMLGNPKVAAKVGYNTAKSASTFFEYLYEKSASIINNRSVTSDFKYNVTRLFSSVIFEELETDAVIRDMKKGTPYIYITYNGYDENSHHQGPSSPAAFKAVKTIDNKIGKIVKHLGDYDLIILSDHGHTESVPFQKLYGTKFEKFIHTSLKEYKHDRNPHYLKRKQADMHKIAKAAIHPFVMTEQGFHTLMSKTFKKQFRQMSWNSHPYFLEVSDPLANLYFNFSPDKVQMTRIERKYPGFMDTLINHPGIGLVIGQDFGKVRVLNKYGEAIIGKRQSDHVFKGERFLKDYGDEKILIKQLEYFARMENSGDLILMGDYSKHNVISFINHYGSHGSAGGEQMHPFFLTNKDVDLSNVTNVAELYGIFRKYHEE
ncbi:MAG: alkaline phosphatase family protein [Nanoarchaeota archaeon]|nr:alkaline phosphatase family protein [Nanoarchaeota archaeon]